VVPIERISVKYKFKKESLKKKGRWNGTPSLSLSGSLPNYPLAVSRPLLCWRQPALPLSFSVEPPRWCCGKWEVLVLVIGCQSCVKVEVIELVAIEVAVEEGWGGGGRRGRQLRCLWLWLIFYEVQPHQLSWDNTSSYSWWSYLSYTICTYDGIMTQDMMTLSSPRGLWFSHLRRCLAYPWRHPAHCNYRWCQTIRKF